METPDVLSKLVERLLAEIPERALNPKIVACALAPSLMGVIEDPDAEIESVRVDPNFYIEARDGAYRRIPLGEFEYETNRYFSMYVELNAHKRDYGEVEREAQERLQNDLELRAIYGLVTVHLTQGRKFDKYFLFGVAPLKQASNHNDEKSPS